MINIDDAIVDQVGNEFPLSQAGNGSASKVDRSVIDQVACQYLKICIESRVAIEGDGSFVGESIGDDERRIRQVRVKQ